MREEADTLSPTRPRCLGGCVLTIVGTSPKFLLLERNQVTLRNGKKMEKNQSASIHFYFEDGVDVNKLKRIARKINTVCKNADYETTVAYFASNKEIQVIITFLDASHHIFDEMRTPLTRLIDSHKEVATYGWSLDVLHLLAEKKVA